MDPLLYSPLPLFLVSGSGYNFIIVPILNYIQYMPYTYPDTHYMNTDIPVTCLLLYYSYSYYLHVRTYKTTGLGFSSTNNGFASQVFITILEFHFHSFQSVSHSAIALLALSNSTCWKFVIYLVYIL